MAGSGQRQRRKGIAWRLPSREELLSTFFLKPFSRHLSNPLLWRLGRRTVCKGLAIGLFAAFAFPVAQTPLAALMAVTLRGNLAIAAAATLVTNPLTVPFFYYCAFMTGSRVMGREGSVWQGGDTGIWEQGWLTLVNVAGPTYVGLLLFGIGSATGAWFMTHHVWQWLTAFRRRRRISARHGGSVAAD